MVLDYSRPGKPTYNPFIESFNGSFRDECLNVNWFLSLDDAYEKINDWVDEYNSFRPHSSLDDLTPEQMIEKHLSEIEKRQCLPAATNDEHMFFSAEGHGPAPTEKTSVHH